VELKAKFGDLCQLILDWSKRYRSFFMHKKQVLIYKLPLYVTSDWTSPIIIDKDPQISP